MNNTGKNILPKNPRDDFNHRLKGYLENNPYSLVREDSADEIYLITPWGDSTLALLLPSEENKQSAFINIINNCILPEKYSAVYHVAEEMLEVIWTSYRLSSTLEESADRRFNFNFLGRTHECWFGESSVALTTIAACATPLSNPTSTNYRNLLSYIILQRAERGLDDAPGARALDKSRSFFIKLVGLELKDIDNLVVHLNAFMSYYDNKSPQVLIHEPIARNFDARDRYLHGSFPAEISGREIDVNALAYWHQATISNNEIMRFLTCYRIIEYLALHL